MARSRSIILAQLRASCLMAFPRACRQLSYLAPRIFLGSIWVHLLKDVTKHSTLLVEHMRIQAGKVAQRARRRAVQDSLRSFQGWIVQEGSLGAVRRCLRSVPYAADEYVDQGKLLFHPKDVVDVKVEQFQSLWASEACDPGSLEAVFNIVREAAKVEQLVPLEPQQIRKAASRMKAKS
eukprot:3329876-Pyramimonas_sp.AAC.1